MTIPNLPVRQSMAVCLGAMLLLLLLVLLAGLGKLQTLRDAGDLALSGYYPNIVLIHQSNTELGTVARAMREALLLRDAEQISGRLAEIARGRLQMGQLLEQLKQGIGQQAGRELLDEIAVVHAAYMVGQEEFVNLMIQGRLGEAHNLLLVDLLGYQNQYFALLARLSEEQNSQMQQARSEVGATYRHARLAMFGLTLLLGLVSLSVIWLFGHMLLRQLGGEPAYAVAVAHEIAMGNLASPITLRDNDVGSLLFSMRAMRDALKARTQDLEASNAQLASTIETLNRAQNELVTSEKLAALGALVAGIAHELNTPIGNGMMAASTVTDLTTRFEQDCKSGIKRSELATYMEKMRQGAAILLGNLTRAANLVASFKQVAVDRTTSRGRRFVLAEVVAEILLTLQPQLKKTLYQIECDIDPNIVMESYPGPLGQVLTNLIQNALLHGFDERPTGIIGIAARLAGDGMVELTLRDDGKGIAPDSLKRIYDPFFTTKLGEGGSGLGLHVTHNIVTGVLQGKITVSSQLARGTTFILHLPQQVLQS
jgi:C4-dicarboxylate-specific signal transduction histidine kinase